MTVYVDAAFAQYQRFDIKFRQRLRGDVTAQAIVPASEKQVRINGEKIFDSRVFRCQLRDGSPLLRKLRDIFIPAGDTGHANHRRL
ncbi:hypothetical protein D3C78_1624240 [compost metagenome]